MIEQKGGLQIIHVDDEAAQRKLVGAFLELDGHKVDSYEDPTQALKEIRGRLRMVPPGVDVVITDGEMPLMNGRELATAIRQESDGASLPIMLLTGNVPEFEGDFPRLFDSIVKKPFGRADLVSGIESALASATKRQSTFR